MLKLFSQKKAVPSINQVFVQNEITRFVQRAKLGYEPNLESKFRAIPNDRLVLCEHDLYEFVGQCIGVELKRVFTEGIPMTIRLNSPKQFQDNEDSIVLSYYNTVTESREFLSFQLDTKKAGPAPDQSVEAAQSFINPQLINQP